jgi:hypothetical protein
MTAFDHDNEFGFKFKFGHIKDKSDRIAAIINARWVMGNFVENVVKAGGYHNARSTQARNMVESECLRLRMHLSEKEHEILCKGLVNSCGRTMV